MPGPLTPWRPFAELDELRTRFDRLYDQWFDGQDRAYTPAIDVEKHDHDITVRADVPGVKPEDVKIEVQDGVLTLSGQHEEHKEKREKSYLRRERHDGSFTRTMALPDGVDPKKIKATTKDGVVQITIPLPSGSKKEPVMITPTAA
jgi:HSP20 family protein